MIRQGKTLQLLNQIHRVAKMELHLSKNYFNYHYTFTLQTSSTEEHKN